ncbi:18 kDa seed maturation protein-like [Vicia villosa]|uniref:18 kDa seed maturation protein-like n=1 Tax=Vicia villosa TaxID=3911 RepID=UPI00273B01B9|nr:18 kDa seed maturation protein-like [Vicia villosa]
MQGAKKAGETIKETAANIGASAKSGLEKTKATLQEKTEKMSARDPVQKEAATQKKEAKQNQAELDKQMARENNAAVKESTTAAQMGQAHHNMGTGTTTYPTTGTYGQPMGGHHSTGTGTRTGTYHTGGHDMSAMPGHHTDHVTQGVVGTHTIGTHRSTDGTAAAHNTRVGGNPNATGYTTGGNYK